ncbi:MAG TPA: SpoIIE family protein phosphatase [Bacteroidia bacterium]
MSHYSFAQTKMDSLWEIYHSRNQSDTTRLKAIHAIAASYSGNRPNNAIQLTEEELGLAGTLPFEQGRKWVANAHLTLGAAYTNKANYPKAMEYYVGTLKVFEELNDKKGITACYMSIGKVFWMQIKYPEALEYYSKGLKLAEQTGNKQGVAGCYNGMGNVYRDQDQAHYSEALACFLKASLIHEQTGNKPGIAACYSNIGEVYRLQANAAQKGDDNAAYKENLYKKALSYYLKGLNIFEQTQDEQSIEICYLNFALVYNSLADYKKAILYCNSSLTICKEIEDMDGDRLVYEQLAIAYDKTGRDKEAYAMHVKFKTLTDSIFNAENTQQLNELAANAETLQKEAEQAKLNTIALEENKRQQHIVLMLVSCLLVLVVVFSLLLYKRFKLTNQQKHIIEEKNKEIIESINYAERIQRSFIATKELLDENLNDYFVLFKPKDIVSGDFYWASKLNNGNFALATADSTGHGVPGAIMSLLNVTSLESAIKDGFINPAEILNDTRKTIVERLKKDGSAEGGKDGMDCSLTVYDFANNKLIVASAQNPVWIVRGTETIEIKPDKMPVGKHDKQANSFTQQEITLQSGDVVYTLTDGFPDQFGGDKGKKFMSKNLRELLAANAHLPMQEQKELLDLTFKNWVGNLEQVDDVTLIGVRV